MQRLRMGYFADESGRPGHIHVSIQTWSARQGLAFSTVIGINFFCSSLRRHRCSRYGFALLALSGKTKSGVMSRSSIPIWCHRQQGHLLMSLFLNTIVPLYSVLVPQRYLLWWCSGYIPACHAGARGSTPRQRENFCWRFHQTLEVAPVPRKIIVPF